jgi:hypothetical protein
MAFLVAEPDAKKRHLIRDTGTSFCDTGIATPRRHHQKDSGGDEGSQGFDPQLPWPAFYISDGRQQQ